MEELEKTVDSFLAQVSQYAENKHEILLGACESELKLTTTQEHILMLLKEKPLTNSEMAEELRISAAAVTKALKKMQAQDLISAQKDGKDERKMLWLLTEQGSPIAEEHAEHHAKTLERYKKLLAGFSEPEQAVIQKFLEELKGELA